MSGAWSHSPQRSGHQWWYSAWNRQRRLLTFDADIEAWFLLDDGHVNETPSPLNGWTHSDVCAFAGEGDMFAPATIPEPPSVRWVVKLQQTLECWIDNVDYSDPGRVCKLENAERFDTRQLAEQALVKARKYRPFKDATIDEVTP